MYNKECNYNTFLNIMNEIKSVYINECNYKQKNENKWKGKRLELRYIRGHFWPEAMIVHPIEICYLS